ncbi:MAG: hypothetical protein Q7T20_06950 [Saprospiraceae bacterium]|nr:hypothetical protein [Saprospiraceae bacterium]
MPTTEIILQINRPDELSLLISFLEKSGISFQQRTKKVVTKTRSTAVSQPSRKNATLGKHIGSMPNLNAEAFELHLNQMRSEWERDTF